MGIWIWPNVLAMLLFFGCWAGIPLWHTLHGWKDEIDAKHAALAAKVITMPTLATVAVRDAGIDEDVAEYAGTR
jgi:hypothetical protein